MYAYIVLLHVVGAFVFALAHGVSIAVSLRLSGAQVGLLAILWLMVVGPSLAGP